MAKIISHINSSRDSKNNTTKKSKCPICMSKRSEKKFQVFRCGHKACKDCIRTYLKLEINEGRTKIGCPISKSCNWRFGRAIVDRLLGSANPEIMQKWDKFKLQSCLNLVPNIIFCPFPDCDWAAVAPKDQKKCPKITCEMCKQIFCYKCRNPWEGNHKQGDKKCSLKNDRTKLIQSISAGQDSGSNNGMKATNSDGTSNELPEYSNEVKPCPQCGALIAKNGGCNHVICTVCNCDFCWLCSKKITKAHYLNPSGCSYRDNENIWFQVLAFLLSILIISVLLPIITNMFTTDWFKKRAAKNKNSTQQKYQIWFQGTITWGATVLSVLVSLIAIACEAVIIAFHCILYIFCIVPLELIRFRTLIHHANYWSNMWETVLDIPLPDPDEQG